MAVLILFVLCYLGFVFFSEHKTSIALTGVLALLLLGQISPLEAFHEVHWNVMGLFIGTLVLAELFMLSHVPAVMAEWLVDKAGSVRMALIYIFMLASIISMFVENVAVVLLVAPVAFSLCEKLKVSPIKPLILLAMFSNLQGVATLIGDPPSMLLASFMKLTFGDFFFYQGKPSLFFITQVGGISALLLAFWLFRNDSHKMELLNIEKVRSWIPSILLLLLIGILASCSHFDPNTEWLAGTVAFSLGLIGIAWHHFGPKWHSTKQILLELDWKSTFFLLSLFILVGALRLHGWMDVITDWMVLHLPDNLFLIYIFIIGLSLLISAFIDNVPFLIAMIPIVQELGHAKGFPVPLLAFAMLIGTCLGGNITPIGASANIVAVSALDRRGHKISFFEYMKTGLIFTAFAVIPSSIFLWYVWK